MSEKDKELLTEMSDTLSRLSRENQKYVLGIAEGMAIERENKMESAKKHKESIPQKEGD